MAKYAVVRINGKQYRVSEGEKFLVEKVSGEPKAEVLLLTSDKGVEVGMPVLTSAKVSLTKIADEKGPKIHVSKFKAKSRYRKKIGFRPQVTRIQVGKIS